MDDIDTPSDAERRVLAAAVVMVAAWQNGGETYVPWLSLVTLVERMRDAQLCAALVVEKPALTAY